MKKKLFYINIYCIIILFFISATLNYMNFVKPLFIVYKNNLYFPLIFNYNYQDFNLNYNLSADYTDKYLNNHLKKNGYVVYLFSYNQDSYIKPMQPPSKKYLLGTTLNSKDLLLSLLKSIFYIIIFGIIPTLISVFIALFIGILQGYKGKYYDMLLYRAYEIIVSIPFIYIILFISTIININTIFLCIAIGCINWTFLLPYVRNISLQYKNHTQIVSLELLNIPQYKIMYKYLAKIIIKKIYPLIGYMFVSNNLAIITISFVNIKYMQNDTIANLLHMGFQQPISVLTICCTLLVFLFFSLSIINICNKLANYE